MKPTAALLLLSLLPLLGACGDGDPAGGAAPREEAAAPALPPVDGAAKARFALDRLLLGPLQRTGRFPIPKVHLLNLEHARADLVALGDETVALLADGSLRERLTRPDGDHNPWHNVLQVLASLDDAPPALVLEWARPALAANDLQLDRRAVRALVPVADGPGVADALLALLSRRPEDRELAPLAFRTLVRLGDPWCGRACAVVLRAGSALVWSHVPALLETARADGAPASDALAWWALLAERTGPTDVRGTARNVAAPWFRGRLIVDDAVWPRDVAELEAAVLAARVVAPARVVDAEGYVPAPADASPVMAWQAALPSGRGAAADARCRLARAGHPAFRATVERDLDAADPALQLTAEACGVAPGDAAEALELAGVVLDAFVEDLEAGAGPDATGVLSALRAVTDDRPEHGARAARAILVRARPQAVYRDLLEAAHDVLASADPALLATTLTGLLRSADAEDRATGLLLVRRGRSLRHAPVLDELLEDAPPAEAALVQRLLIWLHSQPEGVDPEARRAFARRYAAWVERASDAEAAALAPGLLDLGEPGAAAYAAGLAGPRRAVFVRGLLGRSGLVPQAVAEALLAPVDAATSPQDRRAALVAAYRTAPTTAAPFVAALRARLAAADREEVDDVLAVVRHRAVR